MSATATRVRSVERFVAEHQARWAELVDLVDRAGGRLERLTPDEVLTLGDRYRATAADLARARQRWPGDPVVGELEALVTRGRSLVYRTPGRRTSFAAWLTTGFFRRVRERPRALLVAFLLLWGPSIGVAVWAHGDPTTATQVARVSSLSSGAADSANAGGRGDRSTSATESSTLGTQISLNNIRAALTMLAGGLTGGVLTGGVMVFNGAVVGLVIGLFTANGAGDVAMSYLAPHGFLEWSLVTVAGAAGLRVGAALVAPGLRPRATALVEEARGAAEVTLGVALWLVPTGIVEGFVTPQGLPPGVAVAFGLAFAGLFWGLVLWRGRPPQSLAEDLAVR